MQRQTSQNLLLLESNLIQRIPLFRRKVQEISVEEKFKNRKGSTMGAGRKKIDIKKIEKDSSRMVTFSKRRKGLFKKAQEFHSKTGAKVAILVFSPASNPYTYGDFATFSEALNTSNNCTISNRLDLDNHQGVGSSSGTNINGLRQWLDNMDIKSCDDVEQLVRWKEQLQGVKERIESMY